MSHSGSSGTLIVVISRAKDLPNKRKMEKQNPYCLLRISNLTDKTNACIRGGQTPRWDEEFRFSISPEIQPILKISVLDETKKSPVFISETEIDFTPAFYASVKEGYDNWYPLTFNNREAGEIYLEMTFYPSSSSTTFNSSGGSTASKKTFVIAQSNKRRNLPPLPGEEINVQMEDEVYEIPPPIARANKASLHEIFNSTTSSVSSSKRFDGYKPQISIHSLPDVPIHQKKSSSTRHQPENEVPSPYSFTPSSNPKTHQKSSYHIVDGNEDEEEEDQYLSRSLQIEQPTKKGLSSPTEFKNFTKKFASSFSFFGGNKNNQTNENSTNMIIPSTASSNPFDELEREVQSDWTKNNPNKAAHPSSSPKKKAPPVPSHGLFNSSGGSATSAHLPPVPQHSINSKSSISNYNIIEPPSSSLSSSGGRNPSPTRRKPSSLPTSPRLLDIPFDALAIGNTNLKSNEFTENFNIHDPRRKQLQQEANYDDELLQEHNAPTPYDMFVKNAALNKSGTTIDEGRSTISSNRFKTSLPALPPK